VEVSLSILVLISEVKVSATVHQTQSLTPIVKHCLLQHGIRFQFFAC